MERWSDARRGGVMGGEVGSDGWRGGVMGGEVG